MCLILGVGGKRSVFPVQDLNAFYAGVQAADLIYQTAQNQQPPFCFPPISATAATTTTVTPVKIQPHADVSQNTAISDRPKAKPVSKKEGKNVRKVYTFQQLPPPQLPMVQPDVAITAAPTGSTATPIATAAAATSVDKSLYPLDLDDAQHDNLNTANFLQDLHNHPLIRAAFVSSPSATSTSTSPPVVAPPKKANLDYVFKSATKFIEKHTKDLQLQDCIVDDLQCYNIGADQPQQSPVPAQFSESLDESMLQSLAQQQQQQQQDLAAGDDHDGDVSRVEYFAVPNHSVDLAGVQVGNILYAHESRGGLDVTDDVCFSALLIRMNNICRLSATIPPAR